MPDKLQELLQIDNRLERVVTVRQKLKGGFIRVEADNYSDVIAGNYPVQSRLLISGNTVIKRIAVNSNVHQR